MATQQKEANFQKKKKKKKNPKHGVKTINQHTYTSMKVAYSGGISLMSSIVEDPAEDSIGGSRPIKAELKC